MDDFIKTAMYYSCADKRMLSAFGVQKTLLIQSLIAGHKKSHGCWPWLFLNTKINLVKKIPYSQLHLPA